MTKTFKRRMGEAYVLYKIRVGRGATFTSELSGALNMAQQGGVILLLVHDYLHFQLPIWILPVLWITQKTAEYAAGWYDLEHMHWQHFENDYTSRYLNPWNDEVLQLLKDIRDNQKKCESVDSVKTTK